VGSYFDVVVILDVVVEYHLLMLARNHLLFVQFLLLLLHLQLLRFQLVLLQALAEMALDLRANSNTSEFKDVLGNFRLQFGQANSIPITGSDCEDAD
jgi:hypothetical protein